ncbi:hypothetical protein CS053_08635 [Rhodanobacter glycinis]|uniref:Uncharacterized protein n=1 Tax=Rhodanobacter glycinis TaxID=582702 RepID=A0A5B9E222_9GAMM|nr:hypothetical protein CS053_08635 [Rhodanobacter glycinis]
MPTAQEHPDRALISALGGPVSVCRAIGIDPYPRGVQRVQNWMERGIPPAVRLAHLDIFGPAPREGEAS